MDFSTVFKESTGEWSMRRVLAMVFALIAVAAIVLCVLFKVEWRLAALVVGIPVAACLLMLLFTTWEDVAQIVSAVRGKGEK